jgi:CRP/FNR family transcriptional regulator
MDDSSKNFISRIFTFWDKLNTAQQDLILSNTSFKLYHQGENIHSGENDCVGILLIKSGELRTYLLSEDGREISLYRLYSGDVCILSASCILKNITFDVFIDSEQDSEVFLVNSSVFQKICSENIFAENFSQQKTVERFSDVMWAMQQILFMSFDKRLAVFLLDEISKNGSDSISLTHEQIAKYVGSAREVVSRMLKYFESEGIVELFRGGLKVKDKSKLKKMIKMQDK